MLLAGTKCHIPNSCRHAESKFVYDHLLHSISLQAHLSQICTHMHRILFMGLVESVSKHAVIAPARSH